HGYRIHQWEVGRRQRVGREPACLFHPRRGSEARKERYCDPCPKDKTAGRISRQTGRSTPAACRQNEHSAGGKMERAAKPRCPAAAALANWLSELASNALGALRRN